MKSKSPFRQIATALLLMVLAIAGPVSAATITWTNSAGGDWTTAGNWSPNAVPGASDVAVISDAAIYTINVEGNRSVATLVLDNPNATLRVVGNGSVGTSTLAVAGGAENKGIIELTSENANFGATLTVTPGTLTNATGGVIRTLQGAGGPDRNFSGNLDNRGTLEVGHNLTLNGNVANSGTVNIPEGITVTANSPITWTHQGGAITGTGTLSLASGSALALEADFTPGTYFLNAPNLTVNGPAKLLGPPTGEFLIRTWTINAGVIVTGDLRIEGNVTFNSALAVSPGKALRLVGNGTVGTATLTVTNGLVNQGIIELTSENANFGATLTVTPGTLTNATGGVIRTLQGAGGPDRNFSGNLDNRGEIQVLAAATFNMNGTLLNTASGILSGTGTFNLSSATVVNDGTVAPGVSPGILSVTGDLPLNLGARFDVEMAGFTAGTEHDRLVLSSPVSFNGTIRAGLINGFFPKKDDAFTVLMYPSRTGSFTTLDNSLPDRIAWEVQYGPTSAQLVVLNTAPTLAAITNQTVNEQVLFSVTASATDQDLPAQTLTYSLDTAPTGTTINPSSGQITWTPTEAQGPGVFNVTVRVTDNGTPALGHTNSFSVTVNEVNVAPQLALPGAPTVNEQAELVFTINGTDVDLPANALTYELVSGPPGGTFNTTTREFRWTPTEAEGPGNFNATFRVTDNNPDAVNEKQLSTESGVSIVVAEVNLRPTFTPIGNQTINEGTLFSATATATDADLPANPLTYSLVAPPTGMTINPASGAISWTPTEAQGPFTNTITVVVTDTNPPAANAKQLSATNTFQIVAHEINAAPMLPAQTNRTINELTLLTVTNAATDTDIPANGLSYTLSVFPAGATISTSGVITWTPTEAQGPSTNVFTTIVTDTNLADANAPELRATNTFTVIVNELNLAPVLPAQTNRTINELTLLTVTNAATDNDLPAQGFNYTLTALPPGAAVSASGIITWTPSEAQGPSTNVFTTVVTDGNLTATNTFTVIVNELNVPPVLTLPPSMAINELTPYANNATATDADSPVNPLVFELVSGPPGLSLSPAGAITWTPTEAQGPGSYPIQIRVTDTNSTAVNTSSLSVTSSFTLTVNEVNLPSTLLPPANRTIHAGVAIAANATATDPDLPANALTFTKVAGPANLTVSPAGAIAWNTSDADANTTNLIVLRVTDNGAPNLSDTNSFMVAVHSRPRLAAITKTGGVATAVWTAIPGTSYRLQYKTNLDAAAWDDLIGDVIAGGPTASKADATPSTNATRFYRVFILP